MAIKKKNSNSEPIPPAELLISRDEAKSKLQERIQKGSAIKQTQISSKESLDSSRNEYDKWHSFNIELLKRMFTTQELTNEYSSSNAFVIFGGGNSTLNDKIKDFYKDIDQNIHQLDSIIERLELIPVSSQNLNTSNSVSTITTTKKVFIVHGHDEIAKTNLEIFLREIGLEPIVLHRQADEGLTIIEKFEKHSNVGYAFILLTPDEVAYLKTDETKKDDDRRKEFRARPNVIFEFGYFVGKLGRSRVCCLYTGDVALPSDVSGMIYKKFSNSIEDVAYSIIKDLKTSGYDVA